MKYISCSANLCASTVCSFVKKTSPRLRSNVSAVVQCRYENLCAWSHVHPLHCKKASRNSDVDNGGANQTTWGSENSYSHVVWFCATVVNIGIWRIPTWLCLQCMYWIAEKQISHVFMLPCTWLSYTSTAVNVECSYIYVRVATYIALGGLLCCRQIIYGAVWLLNSSTM